MSNPNRFEVRPSIYGGGHGSPLSSHATLDEAESAHSLTDSDELLVILGPDPKNPDGPAQPIVYSRRVGKGKWIREF